MTESWRILKSVIERAGQYDPSPPMSNHLCDLGIAKVVIKYDAEGSLGNIELQNGITEITFDPPCADIPTDVIETVRSFWLDCMPGDWWIDSGSFGTLEIDLVRRQVIREHNRRYLASEKETTTESLDDIEAEYE